MRTYTQKQKTTQKGGSASPARASKAFLSQNRKVGTIHHLQRMIGNQAVQRLLHANGEKREYSSLTGASSRFAHDFSQIPVYSRPPCYPQLIQKGIASSNILNNVHKSAQRGLSGSARPLPYLETIQQSFGQHHALTGVKVFIGGPARNANERMGSTAYATKGSIAFKQSPDLHTAAHEAAHIVQQRACVPLQDGVGKSADRYEQEADAVADSVVHGYSAEPLLDKYSRRHATHTNLVQCDNGACVDLRSALSNSIRVIELYEEFLAGNIEWDEVESHIRTVGIAGQGVVGAGQDLPQIVQDAINEAEGWSLEDITHFGRLIGGLPSLVGGSGEFFNRQRATNEIERQNRLNLVYIRYMYENNCPDFPGQWADYQQQILSIGTRGREVTQQPGTTTTGRTAATRTALAWVEIGGDEILVLATEVAGSRQLRFVRWIENHFRDLALQQARATQGSIPSVPSSSVSGLPFNVPSSATRR